MAGPPGPGLHHPHPQVGPTGAREHPPAHNPGMVYRLWVGVQLADAIAWQESWAHPQAFGFGPARSALDGAAVTKILLEVCRLREWAAAEMIIDYAKTFVLAPALELGMDPGTCRGLGAMYKPLLWAFKIATLGCWWQASNGILQGCPLLVVVVNVLTTISKLEVDSLWTASLHPNLGMEAAANLEVAARLAVTNMGPGHSAVGSSGYADDTQGVALEAASL